MTTKIIRCLAAWIAAFSISVATAQSTIPTPLEKLFRLEGSWQGPAHFNLGGTVFDFTYFFEFKKTQENSGLTMVETFTHADLGTLVGHNLIGYNSRDEKVHWFTVDNFGTTHDHPGYWVNDDHFYMEATEKRGGKKFVEKIDLIFLSSTQISINITATLGGDIIQEGGGVFTKQANPISRSINAQPLPESLGLIIPPTVYPNPATTYVSFNVSAQDLMGGILTLKIASSSGIVLGTYSLVSRTTTISLSGFLPGYYHYTIYRNGIRYKYGSFLKK
jgi:hypothetical protein